MSGSGNNTPLRPCLGHTDAEGIPGAWGREQWVASGGYGVGAWQQR